ncbi:MAG: M48 family metalloprotease [Pseudomonadota bacterium]
MPARPSRHVWLLALLLPWLAACAPAPGVPSSGQSGAVGSTTAATPAGIPRGNPTRSASEQRLGDENHPKILAKFGGAYEDPELTAYVDRIGRRLVAVTEQPGAKWTFTVIDSPDVNAFAVPGGYVYVTRGLLALANDEAELAGVIGHEIAHVTGGHNALRSNRQAVASAGVLLGSLGLAVLGIDPVGLGSALQSAAGGVLASYSRSDELAADALGIRYLADAGYDPGAQADFLASLGANAALDARAAGKRYDPNSVSFFSTHPATGARVQAAEALAARVAAAGGAQERGRNRYLAAIDGMTWGPSPEQGMIRDRSFLHGPLDFTFTVPEGWQMQNTPRAVLGAERSGARFIFDGARDPGGSLTAYIRERWAQNLREALKGGSTVAGLERTRIGGQEAARGLMAVPIKGREHIALFVAIRRPDGLYRFLGLAPRQNSAGVAPVATTAATFRRLTAEEKRLTRGRRVDIETVRGGATETTLGQQMDVGTLPIERFRALNALGPERPLEPGLQVKLVR